MCYKCQGFGHKAEKCEKDQVCVKCTGNHLVKDCVKLKEDYRCKNCGLNHVSWTKNCPKMIQKKIDSNVRSQIVSVKIQRQQEKESNPGYTVPQDHNETKSKDQTNELLKNTTIIQKDSYMTKIEERLSISKELMQVL